MNMVVHYSPCIEPFFCSRRGEFIVLIEAYSVLVNAIETTLWGEFMGNGGCSVIGKFCKR